MDQLVKDQWVECYNMFGKKSLEEWVQERQLTPESRVLVKLASQVSLEEFLEAVMEGEMPPIELSKAEMDSVSGGGRGFACPH